jgi:hypothetical protein
MRTAAVAFRVGFTARVLREVPDVAMTCSWC